MKMKLYKCNKCGQVIRKVIETEAPLICCGEEMKEISPKENEEGLNEKHIPVFKRHKNKVITYVGEILHPSTKDHYIEWILLETNKGSHHKSLKPGDKPEAIFYLEDDEVVEAIYAYCNLHSLWVIRPTKEKDTCKTCGCGIYY